MAVLTLGCVLPLLSCSRPPIQISFVSIPEASHGGENTSGVISGRVTGSRTGDHIVIYVRPGNRWWVQPFANRPLTQIHADGSWSTNTHLGLEFAALLVADKYEAVPVIDALPPVGGKVLAVARIPAAPSAPRDTNPTHGTAATKIISFSGYEWAALNGANSNGGMQHRYDPDNVWVDSGGALHLAIHKVGKDWVCAEASTLRSLGHGSYIFHLRDIGHFEPATMLSLNTWREPTAESGVREMDIHISRWGVSGSKNGEYVMQPYYVPSNVYRFEVPAGPVISSFRWNADSVVYSTSKEERGRTVPVSSWTFTSNVPSPATSTPTSACASFRFHRPPSSRTRR